MNCRRIEKLIPLFVEGDLDIEAMNYVALHISDCEACSSLVSDYSASQSWLRQHTHPEFDNAFYTDLKQSVMQEIEHRQLRPSFFQILTGRWNQKLAYAMAIVMLILVSTIALYIYSGKTKPDSPKQIMAEDKQKQPKEPEQKENEPQRQKDQKNNLEKKYPVKYQRRHFQTNRTKEAAEKLPLALQQKTEPLDNLAINIFDSKIENNPINLNGIESLATPSETTRMEFQTSDPNIRIIWFAPKLNGSPSSKIDTE